MAMTLRLNENDAELLRKTAADEGRSMQEVALDAVRRYVSGHIERRDALIEQIVTERADLIERLRTV